MCPEKSFHDQDYRNFFSTNVFYENFYLKLNEERNPQGNKIPAIFFRNLQKNSMGMQNQHKKYGMFFPERFKIEVKARGESTARG